MASERVQRFLDALRALEESGDVGPMSSLFTSDCEVSNVASPHVWQGIEEAHRFWRDYRGNFVDVRSEFRSIIEAGDKAALEWSSQGEAVGGQSIEYEGVTLLEFEGDQIRRLRAFFDPARLGRQLDLRVGGRSVSAEQATPAYQ